MSDAAPPAASTSGVQRAMNTGFETQGRVLLLSLRRYYSLDMRVPPPTSPSVPVSPQLLVLGLEVVEPLGCRP